MIDLHASMASSCLLAEINDNAYFVGWGTLALINAGLAQSKNRSGLVWFVVSLLLGPVATLVVVILDRASE